MKVKHLSYEELVKLGAKCLAQPKAEVQIFCVKNTKISDKVPPQLKLFTRYVFSVLKRKLKRSFSLGSLRS